MPGTYIFLALLNSSIAVRVGHLGLLAQRSGDGAVNEAQDGDGTDADGNGSTGNVSDPSSPAEVEILTRSFEG